MNVRRFFVLSLAGNRGRKQHRALCPVTEDDISLQLGHRRPHLRTTAGYGEWDPEYPSATASAIDGWFIALQKRMPNRPELSQKFSQISPAAAEQIR